MTPPTRYLLPPAAGCAVLLLLPVLSGCGGRTTTGKEDLQRKLRQEARRRQDQVSSLGIQMSGNSFQIDDEEGRRLLEARVSKMDGKVIPGKGVDGPVAMQQAQCRLFRAGQHQLDLTAPEAVWDGERLIAEKTSHAETPEKDRILDARKSVWTARTGQLDLEQPKLQAVRNGKTEMTVEGARATVLDRVVTLPAGATAVNDKGERMTSGSARWHLAERRLEATGGVTLTGADGGRLTCGSLNWNLETGRLEATGNVTITQDGNTVTGQRLVGDTRLKRGRLTGRPRVVMRKSPLRLPQRNDG